WSSPGRWCLFVRTVPSSGLGASLLGTSQWEWSPVVTRAGSSGRYRWLERVIVNRAIPRQPFGFTFVDEARLNERVIAGPGKFHRVPFTLRTDCVHPVRFSVERHQVDDPQGFLSIFH